MTTTILSHGLALAPVRHNSALAQQGRQIRDASMLLEPTDDPAGPYAQAHSFDFHRLLERLHALPAALRATLLLFEEADLRSVGREHLVEPIPPDTATPLTLWLAHHGPGAATAVVPWVIDLLRILMQLQFHGAPPHQLLRPECMYMTGSGGVLVADLGLSLLVSDPLRWSDRSSSIQRFAAPEYLGRHAYARGDLADVHSVGCLAAWMLLPAADFTFLGVQDARDKYVLPAPDLSGAAVSPRVAAILTAMAAVDPDQRPPLAVACAELDAAWRSLAVQRPGRASAAELAATRALDALVEGRSERIRVALEELLTAAPSPLRRSLSQFAIDPLVLTPLELTAAVTEICELIGRADHAGSDGRLRCLALLGVALHHLGNIDLGEAAAICRQVRVLAGRHGARGEALDLVVTVVEVEVALASGRARELVMVRELLALTPAAPPAHALFAALRGLVALALGSFEAATAAHVDATQAYAPTPAHGLLRHSLARLELQLELARLPVGFSLGDLPQLDAPTVSRITQLAERELSLRVLPQVDAPLVVLFQLHGRRRVRPRLAKHPLNTARWRRLLADGIRWERHGIPGLAVRHYQRALALLPVDAAVAHHVELYAWLASAHQGAAREFLAREYLTPGIAWLARLPFAAVRLAPSLEMGRHLVATPRERRYHDASPKSLLEAIDAEAASTPRRTAHWILLQLLGEFGAVAAMLTLLNQGSKPLHGAATSRRTTYAEALAECGWFDDTPAEEVAHLLDRLRDLQARDPLRVPLALAVLTVPAREIADARALAAAREALQRIAGVDPAPTTNPPSSLAALLTELNHRVTDTRRRFHPIVAPIDAEVVHIAYVTTAAFNAAVEAGLLYFHFTVDYASVSDTGSPYDLLPGRDTAMTGALAALRSAPYTGDALAHSVDTLACRAQLSRGILAELRLTGRLYRTYDEHERRALAARFAELVPAFMLVHDWTDRAPPVPTQLRVLHLMAHEAKRPLLWIQKSMTRLCRSGALKLEHYRELEGLLDLCVARLGLFCGTKMWDVESFPLAPRVAHLLDDWRIALKSSGEELTLSDPFAARPDLRNLPPLWLRGQAVELILSELLENARKHSVPRHTIEISLDVSPCGGDYLVEFAIRNQIASSGRLPDPGSSPTFVDRFNSTGLGMQLLGDLVRQLDDGHITASRPPTDPPEHITRFTFKAPFVSS